MLTILAICFSSFTKSHVTTLWSLSVHWTFGRCPVLIDRIRFGKSAECYCRNDVASQSTALFDYGSARMTLVLLYPFRTDLSCSWRADRTAWAFHVASSHLKGALISLWRLGDLTREFSHLMSLQDVACRSSHLKFLLHQWRKSCLKR